MFIKHCVPSTVISSILSSEMYDMLISGLVIKRIEVEQHVSLGEVPELRFESWWAGSKAELSASTFPELQREHQETVR